MDEPVVVPASTATPPEPPAPPAPGADDEFMEWAKTQDGRTPSPSETPAAPVAAPVASPPAAPPAPVAAAPVAQPSTPPAPSQEPPAPVPFDRKKWREEFEASVAQHLGFTEEEATQLLSEPEKVLPRKLAKMYADAYEGLWMAFASQMPNAVQTVMTMREENDRAKQAFFVKWPKLKEHEPKVIERAGMYRRFKPNATADEVTNAVGASMMVEMGLLDSPIAPNVNEPGPFRPGGTGPGTAPAGQKGPTNDFQVMAEEFIKEDGR